MNAIILEETVKIDEFEKNINYVFKNKKNLLLALTHSSYANENKQNRLESNERLEFLGDSILSMVVSEALYRRSPHLSEGEMTKCRASVVCEASLGQCSDKIGVCKYLLLGKGEEANGGRTRVSILSDAFEAVIGAIYIDGGMDCAHEFIHTHMDPLINEWSNGGAFIDYKTQLQEQVQKYGDIKVTYRIVDEKGPDHDKIFAAEVCLKQDVLGCGKGRSKKEAEQNAAKAALTANSGGIHV